MSKIEESQTFYNEDSEESLNEESEISEEEEEEEASVQDKKVDFYDSIVIEDTKTEYKKDIPAKSNEDLDTYFSDEYSENVTSPDFLPIDKKMYYASRSFIRHEGPVAAHINSYNYAVCYLIPSIVESKGTVSVTHDGLVHKISLSNFYSGKPKHKENNESIITVNPKLCMDRKISYVAPIYVDMTYYNPNGSTVTTTKKCIGEIPVMLMSTLCTLSNIKNDENLMAYLHEDVREVGGYFIVKGQQKVLIHQVKPSHNQICTYKGKNTPGTGPKFAMYAETRSGSTSSHTTTTRAGILAKNNLLAISIPYIEFPIPLGIVFKALGAKSDREIANYIFPEETYVLPPSLEYKDMINIIFKSLEQTFNCQTQDEALNYIGKNGQKFSKHSDREDEDDDEEEKKFKSDEKKTKDTLLAVSYTKHLLANEFLPHVGLGEEFNTTKCHFLGLMIQRALMTHTGLITVTDRDHFMNKRIHTSGMILATQFYNAFRKLMSRISMSMEKNIKNSIPIIASSYITSPYIITSSLISALTCNKWSAKGKNKGVSQAIDNFNFCALLSCLRKFVIPLNTDAGKIEGPRHLHGSQWGVACMYKTPEGKQVGLVQGFAMGAYVSIGSDPEPIIEILKDLDICPMEEIQSSADYLKYTKVFVNGNPRGYTKYPQEITNQLRRLRRSAHIDMEASILYDEIEKSIYISTETGRVGRAVAIAPNGELKLTEKVLDEIKAGLWDTRESNAWVKLVERGYTELLFKDEEEEMNVAIYPSQLVKMNAYDRVKYTHTELTPDLIEGAGVSTSPHNDHNQAPRNIYQESMSHQSIGNTSNAAFLRKGKWFTLKYPQKPIVSTRISRELGFSDMPMGQNVTICAMPWGGRGQEDSVIFHEQALKRGLFATNAYIAYEATLSHPESSNTSRFEAFDIPNPQDCNDFNGDPRKLKFDEDYVYVPVGTEVSKDDILIGMVVSGSPENPMFAKHKNKINKSIRYEYKLPGIVHSVQKGFDDKGYKYIRLVVLQERIPVLGDKVSACCGQKGTVGTIYPTNKMPYLKNRGYTPDMLINPLAFPSRMTIGMLLEMIMGVAITSSALSTDEFDKPLCLDEELEGCESEMKKTWHYPEGFDPKNYEHLSGDASPWDKSFSIDTFYDALKRIGMDQYSEEIAVNPETGEELKYPVFSSVVFYQRLKHMSVDKIHARARGNRHGFHKQPTEGRKKGGGFRFGHMERDAESGDTLIALREGVSVRLESLLKYENVWGWNDIEKGLEKSKQTNFISYHDQSVEHEVVILTLEDGRTIKCSPCHPYLSGEDGKYVEVRDLKVGEKLACGVSRPFVDFEADEIMCKDFGWTSEMFEHVHCKKGHLSSQEILRRSLCLARLIGLAISDGHASKSNSTLQVYVGHQLDLRTIMDDIFRLTGEKAKNEFTQTSYGSNYVVCIPFDLAVLIRNMGIIKGAKVRQECVFPDFINTETPYPILREFLGGLFGGDGHTICLYNHRGKLDMRSISISWTRDQENLDSLNRTWELLKDILKKRFDIESTINNPKLTTHSKNSTDRKPHYEIVLNIPLEDVLKFSELIGFRYCEHKAVRLDVGASYMRLKLESLRQRQNIVDRVDAIKKESTKKKIPTEKALTQAIAELSEKEFIQEYSKPGRKIVERNIKTDTKNKFNGNFINAGKYIEGIGALHIFQSPEENKVAYGVSRDSDVLPVYWLKILDIKYTHTKEYMYDITIKETESHVSNGIVSHNCMLGQGAPHMVNDRLFHQSDAHQMVVCSVCGIQAIDNGTTVECRLCGNSECVLVDIPYGTKLMSDEFEVMNFVPRIITLPVTK